MSENGSFGHNPGRGLGEWQEAMRAAGIIGANQLGRQIGGTKSEILARIREAGLPVEPYVQPRVDDFIKDPNKFFDQIPTFETYFAVFQPGLERAVGVTRDEVIEYVNKVHAENPGYADFYLAGHDYVFSGSVAVDEIGRVTGSFVLGQYNDLSSGRRQPDLTVKADPLSQPSYEFSGAMASMGGGDWQNDESLYASDNGHTITKPEMIRMVKSALSLLPRDGSTRSEGWYEIKTLQHLNEQGKTVMRPYFIKAVY